MSRFISSLPETVNKMQVRAVNLDADYVDVEGQRRDPLSDKYFGMQANIRFYQNHRTVPTGFRIVGVSRVVPVVPQNIELFQSQRTNNPIAVSLRYLGQLKPENSIIWGDETP